MVEEAPRKEDIDTTFFVSGLWSWTTSCSDEDDSSALDIFMKMGHLESTEIVGASDWIGCISENPPEKAAKKGRTTDAEFWAKQIDVANIAGSNRQKLSNFSRQHNNLNPGMHALRFFLILIHTASNNIFPTSTGLPEKVTELQRTRAGSITSVMTPTGNHGVAIRKLNSAKDLTRALSQCKEDLCAMGSGFVRGEILSLAILLLPDYRYLRVCLLSQTPLL